MSAAASLYSAVDGPSCTALASSRVDWECDRATASAAGLPRDVGAAALVRVDLCAACEYEVKVTRPETDGGSARRWWRRGRDEAAAVRVRVHVHGERDGEGRHSGPLFLRMPRDDGAHSASFRAVMPDLGALRSPRTSMHMSTHISTHGSRHMSAYISKHTSKRLSKRVSKTSVRSVRWTSSWRTITTRFEATAGTCRS